MSAFGAIPVWRRTVLLLVLGASFAASVWTYWHEKQVAWDEAAQVVQFTLRQGVGVTDVISTALAPSPAQETVGQTNGHTIEKTGDVLPDGNQRIAAKVLLDPFAPLAVILPPMPKSVPAPAAVITVPTAPPVPFQYMGKIEQTQRPLLGNAASKNLQGGENSQQTIVYLVRGEESFSVSPGENIDANYRFVGIEGETLVFTYLPLSQRQTLPIGP